MLAQEVKRIIRQVFATECRDCGLKRTKRGGLGWYHPVDDHYFVITFRTPRQWNRHWGGFLECKLRIQDQINPRIPRLRSSLEVAIVSLATDADRETMRHWYNEAAAKTTMAEGGSDYLDSMERDLSEMLRVPLQAPLSAEHDNEFLLRFHTEEDVRRWAAFIIQRLPKWMADTTVRWRDWHKTSNHNLTLHQPFLDAIQADPDSDVPRLIYADWLANRGEVWSEVIRIQCRYPDGYMPWSTADRLVELINEHQHRFNRGADDLSVHVGFRRGMIEEVNCTAATFLKDGERILKTFPLVNALSLSKIEGRARRLAEQRELSAMRSLKIDHVTDDDWQDLFQSPYLRRVEQLCVAFGRPVDLARLLDTPLARQLRVLDLSGSRLEPNLVAAFGETDATSGLESLVLEHTGMDDEMARRLSEIATFRGLKRLFVADNPHLRINGIKAILEAEFAPQLELLTVGSSWFDDDLVQRLAESQLSSTIHLSMKHSCANLDKEALKKRFPNCSFGGDFIARQF